MITFNEILFIQIIAGFTVINGIAAIINGSLGTPNKTNNGIAEIIGGILTLGVIAIALIY